MSYLKAADSVLSKPVGFFDYLTAIVDTKTLYAEENKGAWQTLNFFAKPIDLVIQLVSSPVFAAYQTGKNIYTSFKEEKYCKGVTKIVFSPLVFAFYMISNILSTSFISRTVGLVPGTIVDIAYPEERAAQRFEKRSSAYPKNII